MAQQVKVITTRLSKVSTAYKRAINLAQTLRELRDVGTAGITDEDIANVGFILLKLNGEFKNVAL